MRIKTKNTLDKLTIINENIDNYYNYCELQFTNEHVYIDTLFIDVESAEIKGNFEINKLILGKKTDHVASSLHANYIIYSDVKDY